MDFIVWIKSIYILLTLINSWLYYDKQLIINKMCFIEISKNKDTWRIQNDSLSANKINRTNSITMLSKLNSSFICIKSLKGNNLLKCYGK